MCNRQRQILGGEGGEERAGMDGLPVTQVHDDTQAWAAAENYVVGMALMQQ